MAANGFTLTRNPYNGQLLTDSNCVYVDAQNGNDSNPGTRAFPKQTLGVITNQSATYLLLGSFNGIVSISIASTNIYLLGDLNSSLESVSFNKSSGSAANIYVYGLKINYLAINADNGYLQDCVINTLFTNFTTSKFYIRDTFITNGTVNQVDSARATIRNLFAWQQGSFTNFQDVIITDQIVLFNAALAALLNYYFTISNSIILKTCKWIWNGNIIPIIWTSTGSEINDIKTSLTNYANNVLSVQAQKDYLMRIVNNIFSFGTIVYDDSTPNVRVFNEYDSGGNVSDYTLNFQTTNPATYVSSTKSYVGAYRPSFNFNFDFNNVIEIDNNGYTTGNAGDLLKYNAGIYCDVNSQQSRNKVSTGVIAMLKGDTITRFQGSFFRSNQFYLGALQPSTSITKQNAILVEPYDNLTTQSAFPKFCIPINKNVQIAYFSSGVKALQPILFNDLAGLGIATDKNLSEVGTWAITNAMEEWDDVAELPTTVIHDINLRYFKLHLIANRI
ncbi:MAG: hypothetical protein FWD60_04705 [Candidatus Azobacteroides sp.]|nr:hypothetical protein [Candidatus Azobacteroides sp.]